MDESQGALIQLRAYLAQRGLPPEGRLPPERELCDILGVSRGELRKALSVLERNGELWRHVGKGTFLGSRPIKEVCDVSAIAGRTNPRQVMQARLAFEPQIAREAAINATAQDVLEMRRCLQASRSAESWRHYENCDNRFHRAVAEATHNLVLVALFDALNGIRRAVVWGRLRDSASRPPPDHHSFAEHESIARAIEERDEPGAAKAMKGHLLTVEQNLLKFRQAAE